MSEAPQLSRHLRPVILCGGSGTRLWPLSRADFPKHLIALTGSKSLLEETLDRVEGLGAEKVPICVTGVAHRQRTRRLLRDSSEAAVLLLEPVARNTAPAIAAAALMAQAEDKDAILAVLPVDHFVKDSHAFTAAVMRAAGDATEGKIVVLGVKPREPSTAFGYIVPVEGAKGAVQSVARFTEKPERGKAVNLIAAGALWNAGIVVAKAATVLEAVKLHEPTVAEAVSRAVAAASRAGDDVFLGAADFAEAPSISFDRAVLERHDKVAMTPLEAGWRDVGTWPEMAAMLPNQGNGTRVRGRTFLYENSNILLFSPNRLTVALGLRDLVVVDTPDALLVASREHIGALGDTVRSLADIGFPEALAHPPFTAVHRKLKPGERQPLGEGVARHLIVLAGEAVLRIGDDETKLNTNGSQFLPAGAFGTIENLSGRDAELIDIVLASGE